MIKRRMLIIGSYPIENPQHGGQKRLKAITKEYERLISEVKFVGVYHSASYPDHGSNDLFIGQPDIMEEVSKKPFLVDVITGKAINKDIHVRSPFAKILKEYHPEIIHIEQPFNYVGLKPLLRELKLHPKLIFGSQNIEYRMKDKIYSGLKIPKSERESIVAEIKQLETELSRDADLVVAVSDKDMTEHYKMGAKRCVVVPNGIERLHASEHAIKKWRHYYHKQAIKYPIIFVGSGHPPNWLGLLEMMGEDLTFLPQGSKLLLAGGISDYFSGPKALSTPANAKKFLPHIERLGKLTDDDLAGLLKTSEVILLPITSGGGSNLKTAEAIISGKKIVSTKFAFRSYEKYKNLPNLYITDNPEVFKKYVTTAISDKKAPLNEEDRKLASKVQWSHALRPLEGQLKRLARLSMTNKTGRLARKFMRKTKTAARLAKDFATRK